MTSYPHNDEGCDSLGSRGKSSSARLVPALKSNESESNDAKSLVRDTLPTPGESIIQSDQPKVLKTGEMKKRPFQTWNFLNFLKIGFSRSRFFVLFSNGQLDYYISAADYSNGRSEDRKGFIMLSKDAFVRSCDSKDTARFEVIDGFHTFAFVCSTPEDCSQWVEAFVCCKKAMQSPPTHSTQVQAATSGKVLYENPAATASPPMSSHVSNVAHSALQPPPLTVAPLRRSLSAVLIAANTNPPATERKSYTTGKKINSPSSVLPTITDVNALQSSTLAPIFEFPRHATTIDRLVTLSGLGDLQGVMQIMNESPHIASIAGKVFKIDEETGDWKVEKLAYAIPMALNNEHSDVAKYLLQCGKRKKVELEQEDRFCSLGLFPGSGIHRKSCMMSSFGFQPTRLDQLFRASIAVRQSTQEVPTWLGRPMTKLDEKYADILVDRRGKDQSNSGTKAEDAFMITDGVIMEVERRATYALEINELTGLPELLKKEPSIEKAVKPRTQAPFGTHPRYLEVNYEWNAENTFEDENESNIFGKNSWLIVDADVLTVPVCETTPENLAFYGAELITPSDVFEFDIPSGITHVPLTAMRVGKDYVKGFIMQEVKDGGGSGGAYLEWHDTPHLHMPLNSKTSGTLVMGKMEDGKMLLGGFEIKFGTAIYMPPYTLHNDCFLIGKFGCVYSATENFQTGTVLQSDTFKPATFEFV
jgi:hypothetical protein